MKASSLPAGEGCHAAFEQGVEVKDCYEFRCPIPACGPRNVVEGGEEAEDFLTGHFRIKGCFLGDVAALSSQLASPVASGCRGVLEAEDLDRSSAGREEARQDAEQGGFARPVATEEGDHLARSEVEVDAFEGARTSSGVALENPAEPGDRLSRHE
jgi:hypothetical protein